MGFFKADHAAIRGMGGEKRSTCLEIELGSTRSAASGGFKREIFKSNGSVQRTALLQESMGFGDFSGLDGAPDSLGRQWRGKMTAAEQITSRGSG